LWLLLFITLIMLAATGKKEVNAQVGSSADIFRLVNQLRVSYGLPPFIWDNSLAAAAQNQAVYMATNNIYSHTGAGGSSPASRAIAAGYPGRATENIVGGTDLTPNQGVIWWQNSPTHFNTMISERYVHAGVGFAQGHDQNFYALVVGVPSDQSSPPVVIEDQGGEAFAPVAPIQLASPRDDGSIIHIVGAGHSFWAIAARYEIPLEQLYLYNNISEDSIINPGDELIIRLAEGQLPPPTPTPPATHIVNEGDSLWTIAAWHKLSLANLLLLNAMEEDSLLSPGDEIRIRLLPGEEPPPTATPPTKHIIRSGDTAWGIAVEYNLSVTDLLAFNDMDADSVLTIGNSLLVVPPSPTPTSIPDVTATPLPTATLMPLPTLSQELTITPVAVAVLNSQPTLTVVPAVVTMEDNQTTNSLPFSAVIIVGLGLISAGIIAITFFRHAK